MIIKDSSAAAIWTRLVDRLLHQGTTVAPRGLACKEHLNVTLELTNALNNIIYSKVRNVSYRFMVAEWLWIWYGHDDVKTISQYNKKIADFSDNGVNFNGSYGIPIIKQWPHILKTLQRDPDSRQAVIQIYRPPLFETKDVPCTLSIQFLYRAQCLHTIVNMRSSDAWLGIPYDIFNFTMLGNILAAQLGNVLATSLTMNLGSSHLYAVNHEAAKKVSDQPFISYPSPRLHTSPPDWLERVLVNRTLDISPIEVVHGGYWLQYARCLTAATNEDALKALCD